MDYTKRAEAVREAAQAAGLDVSINRHRDAASIQYGYSFVRFCSGWMAGRKEGEGQVGSYPLRRSYDTGWVDWAVSVLALGRTVECGKGVGLDKLRAGYVQFDTVDYSLTRLEKVVFAKGDEWDLDPDYQRGHVWTEKQQQLFLGHLFEVGRMPLVFLNMGSRESFTERIEVLDGKQRITACLRFLRNELPAELLSGRQLWFKDFDERDRRGSPRIKCAQVYLGTRAEVLRFYLRLNAGGIIHSQAELDRVRAMLAREEGS